MWIRQENMKKSDLSVFWLWCHVCTRCHWIYHTACNVHCSSCLNDLTIRTVLEIQIILSKISLNSCHPTLASQKVWSAVFPLLHPFMCCITVYLSLCSAFHRVSCLHLSAMLPRDIFNTQSSGQRAGMQGGWSAWSPQRWWWDEAQSQMSKRLLWIYGQW